MARYYQRVDHMVYFSCVSPDNEILLCQYNEDKGTTRLFTIDFDNKQYTTAPFFLIKDHLVYWEIRDKDNLSLIRLYLSLIWIISFPIPSIRK